MIDVVIDLVIDTVYWIVCSVVVCSVVAYSGRVLQIVPDSCTQGRAQFVCLRLRSVRVFKTALKTLLRTLLKTMPDTQL